MGVQGLYAYYLRLGTTIVNYMVVGDVNAMSQLTYNLCVRTCTLVCIESMCAYTVESYSTCIRSDITLSIVYIAKCVHTAVWLQCMYIKCMLICGRLIIYTFTCIEVCLQPSQPLQYVYTCSHMFTLYVLRYANIVYAYVCYLFGLFACIVVLLCVFIKI